jgi:hypothetical protein
MIRLVLDKLVQNAAKELDNFGNAKTEYDRDKAFHRYQILLSLIRKDIPDLFVKDKESFTKVTDDATKKIEAMQRMVILG